MNKKIIVVANLSGKLIAEKAKKGDAVQKGIRGAVGTYFTDGLPVADKLKDDTEAMSSAASTYEQTNATTDKDAMDKAEETFGVTMDETVMYVQKKCNADTENAIEIAHTAALDVKKNNQKKPKPDTADTLDAVFNNVAGTILVELGKLPKYSRYLEVYVTTTPNVESSWVLTTTMAGKKVLLENLVSGTRYYIRVVSCNIAGKSTPSNPVDQLAA